MQMRLQACIEEKNLKKQYAYIKYILISDNGINTDFELVIRPVDPLTVVVVNIGTRVYMHVY